MFLSLFGSFICTLYSEHRIIIMYQVGTLNIDRENRGKCLFSSIIVNASDVYKSAASSRRPVTQSARDAIRIILVHRFCIIFSPLDHRFIRVNRPAKKLAPIVY